MLHRWCRRCPQTSSWHKCAHAGCGTGSSHIFRTHSCCYHHVQNKFRRLPLNLFWNYGPFFLCDVSTFLIHVSDPKISDRGPLQIRGACGGARLPVRFSESDDCFSDQDVSDSNSNVSGGPYSLLVNSMSDCLNFRTKSLVPMACPHF